MTGRVLYDRDMSKQTLEDIIDVTYKIGKEVGTIKGFVKGSIYTAVAIGAIALVHKIGKKLNHE